MRPPDGEVVMDGHTRLVWYDGRLRVVRYGVRTSEVIGELGRPVSRPLVTPTSQRWLREFVVREIGP